MPLWKNEDAASNSTIYAVAQVNKSITTANQTELFANVTADVYGTGRTVGQFGISTAKAAAGTGVAHAGWVLRTEGSGGRAGRVFTETLVAGGSISGSSQNVQYPDARIIISTQPSITSLKSGNAVSAIVVASTLPENKTISYFWQVDGGPGSTVFANVANSGVYAGANGNTTSTLSISNNALLTGNVYRCMLLVAGGNTVFTSNATLTVAP